MQTPVMAILIVPKTELLIGHQQSLYTRSRIYGPPRDHEKIDHKSENDHISEDHICENWFFNDHISENPCPASSPTLTARHLLRVVLAHRLEPVHCAHFILGVGCL